MALSGFWADQEDGKRKRKSIDTEPKSPLNQEWIQVHADQEYTIQVEANRLHGGNRVCISLLFHIITYATPRTVLIILKLQLLK